MKTMITGTAALVAALAFASPANAAAAGLCPKPGSMNLANAPTMPKGVTDTIIGSVDLAGEIGVNGRMLRTRRLVIQPGGIVPLHSHKDRPALIYTLSGSITEYSSACAVPINHKAGDITLAALEQSLGVKDITTIPNHFSAVNASINQGVPIDRLQHKNPVARALHQLADEVAPPIDNGRRNSGWLSSMFGGNA